MIAWIVLYIIISYLIGAVPFGYLAGKCNSLDLREHGSQNIGATNAWRVLGWQWGLPVFILDFVKGFIPVYGVLYWLPLLTGNDEGWSFDSTVVLTCFAVVLGHTYTCFLGFKGGKGVATTAGALVALNPVVACIALGTWVVCTGLSGIVSLGSVIAALVMMGAGWWYYSWQVDGHLTSQISYIFFFTVVDLLIIIKHRSNMVRLFHGTEHSFYSKKSK